MAETGFLITLVGMLWIILAIYWDDDYSQKTLYHFILGLITIWVGLIIIGIGVVR